MRRCRLRLTAGSEEVVGEGVACGIPLALKSRFPAPGTRQEQRKRRRPPHTAHHPPHTADPDEPNPGMRQEPRRRCRLLITVGPEAPDPGTRQKPRDISHLGLPKPLVKVFRIGISARTGRAGSGSACRLTVRTKSQRKVFSGFGWSVPWPGQRASAPC